MVRSVASSLHHRPDYSSQWLTEMRFFDWLSRWLLASLAVQTAALSSTGRPGMKITPSKRQAILQDIVTWDQHTLFVNNERILFYSGEFHPFRLPVRISFSSEILAKSLML